MIRHGEHAVERVEAALAAMRKGRMIILVDDEERENEGDLCIAAEKVTPAAVNFMAKHGRGLICLTLEEEQVARLELPMMSAPGRNGPSGLQGPSTCLSPISRFLQRAG